MQNLKKLTLIGLFLITQLSWATGDVVGKVEDETSNAKTPNHVQNISEADVNMANCLVSSGKEKDCQASCTLSHDVCQKHMDAISHLKPGEKKALANTDLKKMVRNERDVTSCKRSCQVCIDTTSRGRCEFKCDYKGLGFGCY